MLSSAIVTGVINLVLFGLLVAFCHFVHREGLSSLWLHTDRRGRHLFSRGAMVGLSAFATYAVLVILIGRAQYEVNAGGLRVTLACAAAWGLGFLSVALFEEALFRGYLLRKSLDRLPRWPAVLLPSLLFGAFHAFSYGPGRALWLGLMNASLFGVVFSLVVLRSRSLMAAIGLHWAWNLAQDLLLVPSNEGLETLFRLRVDEGLWTGASHDPETGLVVTVIVVLLGLATVRWLGQASPTAVDDGRHLQSSSGEDSTHSHGRLSGDDSR